MSLGCSCGKARGLCQHRAACPQGAPTGPWGAEPPSSNSSTSNYLLCISWLISLGWHMDLGCFGGKGNVLSVRWCWEDAFPLWFMFLPIFMHSILLEDRKPSTLKRGLWHQHVLFRILEIAITVFHFISRNILLWKMKQIGRPSSVGWVLWKVACREGQNRAWLLHARNYWLYFD